MYKVKLSSKKITPYGGLNFIHDALRRSGIKKLLDKQLGYRNPNAKYSYSDAVVSLLYNALAQGERLSDLQTLKKQVVAPLVDGIPSPDTVEYICQELKTQTQKITVISKQGKEICHEINYSDNLNKGLVELGVETGQLKRGEQEYVLDYDNIVVETEKQDALLSYKMVKGYHPNVSFVGRVPVHLENHNGNTPASYGQTATLRRCLHNLKESGIIIKEFRADAASYQQEVIEEVIEHVQYFYIRLKDCGSFRAKCGQVQEWEKVRVNNERIEVASIPYAPFDGTKEYRAVVTRSLRADGQCDIESGTPYNFYGVITNNEERTEQDVITFYNQRGDAENSNRFLLNDFNWHRLPFPDMDTNTAYMYLMAMCNTLFEWIKDALVANEMPGITKSMRVKAFCFRYIMVAAQFITHARQKIFRVYSQRPYRHIQCQWQI